MEKLTNGRKLSERDIEVIKQMKGDIEELNKVIEVFNNTNKTLEEVCNELQGFNLEEDYFDFDYGVATHTIRLNREGKLELQKGAYEIWDDREGRYIGQFSHKEVLEIVENN